LVQLVTIAQYLSALKPQTVQHSFMVIFLYSGPHFCFSHANGAFATGYSTFQIHTYLDSFSSQPTFPFSITIFPDIILLEFLMKWPDENSICCL
jgi:hypothetical protein